MGFIRKDFGRIAIESRRESFIIHAGYGFQAKKVRVGDLRLRDRFYAHGKEFRVSLLTETRVQGRDEQFSTVVTFSPDQMVEIDDEEEGDHPLGEVWREYPHPEFENEDLDDLIAALIDFRESRGEQLREGR